MTNCASGSISIPTSGRSSARYRQQLAANDAWQPLVALLRQGQTLTLLYGSKDTEHNQGVVLREFCWRSCRD